MASDFQRIIAAARSGDPWAWSTLYRDLSPIVLGYLRARRAPEPEDVTGDVFVHIVRNLNRFEGNERDFRAWALTIAHRRMVDALRRRSRSPSEALERKTIEAAGVQGDVEQDALGALGLERVRLLIGRLTPDQQGVLLLRILGDLTLKEVAETLGKRPTAVKALQRRALATLRRQISAEKVSL